MRQPLCSSMYRCILPLEFHIHNFFFELYVHVLCLITIWKCATLTSWALYNKGENNRQKKVEGKKLLFCLSPTFQNITQDQTQNTSIYLRMLQSFRSRTLIRPMYLSVLLAIFCFSHLTEHHVDFCRRYI